MRRLAAPLLACCLLLAVGARPVAAAEAPSDQQRARAYVRTAVVDAVGTAASVADIRGCRADRAACADRLRDSQSRIQGFQKDLDAAGSPPACLEHADDLLRGGLDFAQEGLGLAADGVERQSWLTFTQGAALFVAGAGRTARGAGQAIRADC